MQNVKTCERMSFGMVEMRFVFAIKYLSKYANNSLASFFLNKKLIYLITGCVLAVHLRRVKTHANT